jgi:hypothetical protein
VLVEPAMEDVPAVPVSVVPPTPVLVVPPVLVSVVPEVPLVLTVVPVPALLLLVPPVDDDTRIVGPSGAELQASAAVERPTRTPKIIVRDDILLFLLRRLETPALKRACPGTARAKDTRRPGISATSPARPPH